MARQSERRDSDAARIDNEISLYEQVGDWLAANDWTCDAHPDNTWYSTRYQGECADWRIIVDCAETASTRRVLIYSIFSFRVPAARRAAVSEFMTRANYGTLLGNFELDFSDGEVRFRTAADVADGEMTDSIIERLLVANLHTSGRYLAALLGCAFGRLEPAEAVSLSEVSIEGSLQ